MRKLFRAKESHSAMITRRGYEVMNHSGFVGHLDSILESKSPSCTCLTVECLHLLNHPDPSFTSVAHTSSDSPSLLASSIRLILSCCSLLL